MDIKTLVDSQREYFKKGETLEYSFRLHMLKKLLREVESSKEEILTALKGDLNKSDLEGYITEIGLVCGEIKYACKNLAKWMRYKKVKSQIVLFPAKCYIVPEPYGVALIMSPWNYPFLLSMQPLVGAIAAGNCAVIKTSAFAPMTAKVVDKIIRSCFREEYCAVIQGSRKENEELLKQKFDYIFFTGSVEVGKVVMRAAAENLTPVTLELGGKSPVIIDETARIDLAAKRLVFAKFINSGQTCVAPDYVLVHESKKDELIAALDKYIKRCYPKDSAGNVIDYPRIINEKHFARLCGLMKGENIVIGGGADEKNLSIEPTVLTNTTFDSPVMQEEIFGPILPIIAYQDLQEAIDKITARPKPLALYLFSQNKDTQRYIEKTVSYGGGCINDCVLHLSSHQLPFGGVGDSGMGQYHGRASFDTFTHYKGIVNKSTKIDLDVRYRPYTPKKAKMLGKM